MRQVELGLIREIDLNTVETGIISRMIYYKGRKSSNFEPIRISKDYTKIVSTNLTNEFGWLLHKQIETRQSHEPKIYDEDMLERYPKETQSKLKKKGKNRHRYLFTQLHENKKIIDIKNQKYYPSNGSKEIKDRPVYKVKTDVPTFNGLFLFFYSKGLVYEFMLSDYYRNHTFRKSLEKYKPLNDWISRITVNDKLMKELKITLQKNIVDLIPPSFIKGVIEKESWYFRQSADEYFLEYDFEEIWKSYLMYDYTICDIVEYRELMKKLIDYIGEITDINHLIDLNDAFKNWERTKKDLRESKTNKKQTGGQNEEKN
jgi:hypothetical protein